MAKINFQQLRKLLPGVKRKVLLKNYTTFRIGGQAKYFFIAKTKEDLIKAISTAKKINLPFFILGGGSNLLVSDKGFKGIVIKVQLSNFKIQKSKILVEASTSLSLLVNKSMKNNLTGLEWAVGIPGTIGGAIYGNAGAFGKSMQDIVKEVEIYDLRAKKIKILKIKNCKFGYRDSIFKHKKNLIILSAEIQLKRGNKEKIKEIFKKYLKYRKKIQPVEFPSAGSIFKNYEAESLKNRRKLLKKHSEFRKIIKDNKIPTSFLIEKCDLKGKKVGQAQISKKHANFIVNLGNAKAKDVKKLINLMKKKVKNKFGITLKEEIQYLGF